MIYKNFAGTEEKVSLLGFGAWGIGKSMWVGAEDIESKKTLHKAIEQGVNLYDSALVYGNGHSEELVGEVEKEYGQKLFITSKILFLRHHNLKLRLNTINFFYFSNKKFLYAISS